MMLYILITVEPGKDLDAKIFFSREDGVKYMAQHSEWHLHATYATYTIDTEKLEKIKREKGL